MAETVMVSSLTSCRHWPCTDDVTDGVRPAVFSGTDVQYCNHCQISIAALCWESSSLAALPLATQYAPLCIAMSTKAPSTPALCRHSLATRSLVRVVALIWVLRLSV